MAKSETFNHLSNELFGYFLSDPEASLADTIRCLYKNSLITLNDGPSQGLIEFIIEVREQVHLRETRPRDWIDDLPKDNFPLFSNPSMTGEYGGSNDRL